jgi:hypothetical protein
MVLRSKVANMVPKTPSLRSSMARSQVVLKHQESISTVGLKSRMNFMRPSPSPSPSLWNSAMFRTLNFILSKLSSFMRQSGGAVAAFS